MLEITISAPEGWDEVKEEFIEAKSQTIQLEHSLVSISKWESKWQIPFLSKKQKSYEETIDYIKCMTRTQKVDPEIYNRLTNENISQINAYIENSMTATWFSEDRTKNSNEQITSELIYYWMIALNIPPEYQKWHLNRLLTLIRVCNIKNQDPKKMSKNEVLRRNQELNAARRKQYNTKG